LVKDLKEGKVLSAVSLLDFGLGKSLVETKLKLILALLRSTGLTHLQTLHIEEVVETHGLLLLLLLGLAYLQIEQGLLLLLLPRTVYLLLELLHNQ
jgi:hypothetical protein